MAAVTRVKARPQSPTGYEVNDSGAYTEAVVAGDLLVINGENASGHKTWGKAPTTTKDAHGIALMDGYTGGVAEVGIQGEMDGFSGLTAGADLFPSGSVAGGIDTTAPTYYSAATTPAVAVPAIPRIRAIGTTRIRYNFL
jgi:hypothetical protein